MEKPALYQDEMALCLWDEFGKYVSIQSMSRALASVGWSKKLLDKLRRNKMRSYAISTSATYLVFGRTIWFLSQVVTKGLGFDELLVPSRGYAGSRFQVPS